MSTRENDLFDKQGIAAIDAYDSLKASVECQSLMDELVGECDGVKAIYMAAWMVVYQLSLESQHIIQRLDDIVESIDCAGAKPIEFWMKSDIAAMDKANELGIDILPDYSISDLRYKIHQAIHEVA